MDEESHVSEKILVGYQTPSSLRYHLHTILSCLFPDRMKSHAFCHLPKFYRLYLSSNNSIERVRRRHGDGSKREHKIGAYEWTGSEVKNLNFEI